MMPIIRDMMESDAAAAKRLQEVVFAKWRDVYRPIAGPDPDGAKRFDLHGLVAVMDQAVVGVVKYYIEQTRLHLMGLAVDPNQRGRGIARNLIERLESIARERGLKELSLYTVEETGNVAIFSKLGFCVLTREPAPGLESQTGGPVMEAYMVKVLS